LYKKFVLGRHVQIRSKVLKVLRSVELKKDERKRNFHGKKRRRTSETKTAFVKIVAKEKDEM
jgi:hypothetical protein